MIVIYVPVSKCRKVSACLVLSHAKYFSHSLLNVKFNHDCNRKETFLALSEEHTAIAVTPNIPNVNDSKGQRLRHVIHLRNVTIRLIKLTN